MYTEAFLKWKARTQFEVQSLKVWLFWHKFKSDKAIFKLIKRVR